MTGAPAGELFRRAAARCTASAADNAQAALDRLNSGAPEGAIELLRAATVAARNAHTLITYAEEAEKK